MASARVVNFRSPLVFSGPWQLRQADSRSGFTSSTKSTLSAARLFGLTPKAVSTAARQTCSIGLIQQKEGATVDAAPALVNLHWAVVGARSTASLTSPDHPASLKPIKRHPPNAMNIPCSA